ncbi:MAG: putative peptidoglycan biosynthesis protein MurJ [Verrucomicrobia bacterium ADurb.Bin345]|nr:MAG: putative peptidoglycan biosynthesis protein MurJ [Verrucomicrobia bacterium ADurb.Bin345]
MEQRKVIRSAMLIGGFTSMSRVLGLMRDFLTAGFFGTSPAMSAFVVAFRIPNLFRALFGEGALSSAFVPVFIEARQKEGDQRAWLLARKVITLVATVLFAVVLAGIAAITLVLRRPDLGVKTGMILPLVRIMLPYMMFICLAALSMAILNSHHRFALPAFTPSLLNITWIAFILLVCPRISGPLERQIYGLAWGVFVAGIIQLGMQIPALWRFGYRPGLSFDFSDPRVWKVFTLMGPAALGLAVYQVNAVVDSLLATWVGSWAPAALFYSERLLYLPQGILATALSTVLLPVLSGHAARSDFPEITRTLNHSLRSLFFIMAPAAVGLFALARPIIQMIFEWKAFDAVSTELTARALWFYAPGLLVFCLAKVFVPAFYATQDTRTPVRIGLCCVALNFTLNVTFILTWPQYWKHAGLALATVISEGVNGFVLGYFIHRRMGSPGWRTLGVSMARIMSASIAMGLCAFGLQRLLFAMGGRLDLAPKLTQVMSVLGSIAVAIVIYILLALLLRCPELHEVRDAIRLRRGNKATPVSG